MVWVDGVSVMEEPEMFEVWFDGCIVVEVGDIPKKYAPHAMFFQGPHAAIR
jgi:hypothetical protein